MPSGVAAIPGSVTDADLMCRVVKEHRIQTVFHLAGQSLMGEALQHPAAALEVNLRGFWNVLEAARLTGACQVILASSGKVYADAADQPLREDAAIGGGHPYSTSKACAEMVAGMYAASYSLPVGIVRCGNLFGGGDCNWSRVIPGLIRATLQGERFVVRGDGRSLRDYLYIEDAITGFLQLAEALAADRALSGHSFNLGLGRGTSVLELCDLVFRITGCTDLPPVILGAVSDEAAVQYLHPEKAQTLLQWSPRQNLEDGLSKTVAWYRQYTNQPHAVHPAWDQNLEPIGV